MRPSTITPDNLYTFRKYDSERNSFLSAFHIDKTAIRTYLRKSHICERHKHESATIKFQAT